MRKPIPTAVSTAHVEPARLIATGHTNYNSLWYVGRDFLHRATLYVGQAFTGRVHRGNPFRKAAELSGQPRTHPTFGPPPDAHTLVIQGGAPTELSRSREIVGDRGRSWELSRLREAREGGALPSTPANSSLLKDYLMQRGQAAATQAASERWK